MKYSFVIADTDAQLGTTFLEYEKEIAKGILHYIEQVYTEQGIIFPDNGEIYIIKSPSSINPRFCLGSKNNFANDFIIITAKKLLVRLYSNSCTYILSEQPNMQLLRL